jgi:hypothetical protein
MDTKAVPGGGSHPFIFTPAEVRSFFDDKGRFRLKALRARQAEKALQVILLECHNIGTVSPEEVHQYVTLNHFSLAKARRTHWGYYLLTVDYAYRGTKWRHVFRFERNTSGGLSGTLYFNSRRLLVAK